MSQFVNLEEGTSGQLPMGHRNGTNTEVSGHIQRGTPDNSGVEVQGISSSISTGRESTRPFYGKALLQKILSKVWPLVNISPFIWCAIKITIDPFFLYYTVINYDKKCVEIDNALFIVGVCLVPLRILSIIGSLAFLVTASRVGLLKNRLQIIVWFLLLIVDSLSYIPISSSTMVGNAIWPDRGLNHGGSNFYAANFFLLQYFLTVILLYRMFTRATRTWATLAKATWAQAAFNLFLYIHGGHVFGGLWYAFAIGKEIDCWKKACKHYALECSPRHGFTCERNSRDYRFINEFCPMKTQNRTAYEFGIYHDALESGIVEMRNFPKRVLHCFRWGLQNLSAFGQSLQASTDAWENILVISITIYSMVLFVFFIGNVQIYLQLKTVKSEMIRQKKQQIEQCTSFAKLSENLQKQIKRFQPDIWEETKGVDFEFLFNLPEDLRKNMKRELCLELLKKVDEFRSWSEQLLEELCDCVRPVFYAQHAEIVRKGSSIDEMLFLVHGKLQTYSLTSVDTGSAASPPRFEISIHRLEEGKFCGEELVAWFQNDLYSSNLPISTRTIQTITKVDAFALMSYDLQNVFIKHQTAHSTSTQVQAPPPADSQLQAPPPPAEPPAQQPASGI